MSFWDLPGFISLLEQSGFPAQRHRLHFNVLLARPVPVLRDGTGGRDLQPAHAAARRRDDDDRRRRRSPGSCSIFCPTSSFALGLSAKMPVLLAAWTPTGVSMIFGASMLLHLEDG